MSFWTICEMSFKTGRSVCRVACALRPPLNCTLGIYVPIVTPKLYPIPGIIPILCIILWRRRYIAEPTQTKTFNCEICVSILTVIVKIWRYAICVVIASIVSYRTRYMVGNPPVLQVNKKTWGIFFLMVTVFPLEMCTGCGFLQGFGGSHLLLPAIAK